MTRWVMRSKTASGNQTSSMHNVLTTKMQRALISFWFTTFVHMHWNTIFKHIIVLHGPSCSKFQMPTGIICYTITWWSWLFMCWNLWLPTCFFECCCIPCWCLHFGHKIHKGLCVISCENIWGLWFFVWSTPLLVKPQVLHHHNLF